MKTNRIANSQSGAVSLFMVIFAMLLMSVITISFLRIMTDDQRQASNNDLAQSAYDSALAGVEDAKRALLAQQEICRTNPGSSECAAVTASIASNTCNLAITQSGVVRNSDYTTSGGKISEIKVQQSQVDEGGNNVAAALDQAYTCVTIQPNTDHYVVPLPANESRLIPLISTGPFQSVTVEWTIRKDILTNNNPAGEVDRISATTGGAGSSLPLYRLQNWPQERPALMRTQFIQAGDNFSLSGFDHMKDGQSNANTLFLYPTSDGIGLHANQEIDLTSRDIRRTEDRTTEAAQSQSAPLGVYCKPQVFSDTDFACRATIRLPGPIGGGGRQAAFLRLTGFYRDAQVRIGLVGTQFKAVQPIVDSTGRANDLFRRVESRVDLYDTSFPYPDAAVDVNGNFCKDFSVTDTEYIAGTCTP